MIKETDFIKLRGINGLKAVRKGAAQGEKRNLRFYVG